LKYYRRKRHGDKRTRKVVLRILFVLFAAAVIAVLSSLLGNHLKKMVEESAETTSVGEMVDPSEEGEPSIERFPTGTPGEKITVSAIGIDLSWNEESGESLSEIKEHFDTVSIPVSENGSLVYTSPALLDYLRIPTEESQWEAVFAGYRGLRELCSLVKAEGLRLSAVMEASHWESDKVLVGELVSLGFDEVIVTGFDEITGEALSYFSAISGDSVDIGAVFPAEEYLKAENERRIRLLSASGILLCVDLNTDRSPFDEVEKRTKTLVSKLRSAIEEYHVRFFLDTEDEQYICEEYKALLEYKAENIQITKQISHEELTANVADRSQVPQDDGAETMAPVNPYITTAPAESEGDQTDQTASETTDDGVNNPIWY